MSYVDEVACAIRGEVPQRFLPDGDTAALFRIYAVLTLVKGKRVELEDVHDAWAAWMSQEDPNHPSLKPLRDLPTNIRRQDEPYLKAIRAVASKHRLGR